MIAVLLAGALGLALGGCAVRHDLPPQDLSIAQRLAVSPCDQDGARVELVGVRPEQIPSKPMIDRENYLVDLRVRSGTESWLIVNQDAASSGVNSVSKESQEAGWWLGDLEAYLIPRAGDVTLKDLHVNVGTGDKLPAILASITVDGKTPQRWVQEGGEVEHRFTFGGKLVPLGIDVKCVSWFDLHTPVHAASP